MDQRGTKLPAYMSSQVAQARRFYLGRPKRSAGEPTVVSGGWERSAPDYRIERSGFPYYTLEFVARGRGTLRLRGHTHPLARGSVFAYGPGIEHTITTDAGERLAKYFVNLAGPGAEAALRASGVAPGSCQTVTAIDEVQAAYEQLLFVGRRGTKTSAKIAALQGRILLLLVSDVRQPGVARANHALHAFLRCREFLENHFLALQSAEAIAVACHVTPEYLSRLFVRFAGQPPYRLLMRLKMHHAASLLDEQHLLVREVADKLGMDPFQFSRAFKRVHGMSPLAFGQSRTAAPGRGNGGAA
ncbi:MAG TPA: AraC family transcriptional regulator [Opitutaceae bacterium]|nr:AraC family transcriptional regulator [Opitutaceae bacterium]